MNSFMHKIQSYMSSKSRWDIHQIKVNLFSCGTLKLFDDKFASIIQEMHYYNFFLKILPKPNFFFIIYSIVSTMFSNLMMDKKNISLVTALAFYYVLAGVVYQAPDVGSLINSRLVRFLLTLFVLDQWFLCSVSVVDTLYFEFTWNQKMCLT